MGSILRTAGLIQAIATAVLVALAGPLHARSEEKPAVGYRLGIFPYMAPRQTVEFYGPVAANLQRVLNRPVKLESAPTFADFSRRLAARSYDIALIQPFDFPEVVEEYGYLPLAQMAVPLVTQFFVRDDSRYRNIEDLRGSTVAMPPAQSANARMALRALHNGKLVPGRDLEVRYFNSHDSCIQQVWAGVASACATGRPPITVFEQHMQAKLRPIYDTPPIPHIVFVAHPRIPAAERARLQKLITGWNGNDEGRALLKGLGFPGFMEPKPDAYKMIRNYDPAGQIANGRSIHGEDLLLGVFPFLAARQLAHNFAPALPALSKAAGAQVYLRTAASFDRFSDSLGSASYDVALVQPFSYAMAVSRGYLPLAGMKEGVHGTFFVLNASRYRQISDFKGTVIAMPPADAAQSRLGYRALLAAGIVPGRDVTIDYRKNHDSCLQRVQTGAAAACVTAELTLAMLTKDLSQGLRPVGRTETVPGVLFMAHKRLPSKTRAQLQAEIISWKDRDDGRKILRSLGFGDFAAVNVAEYQRLSTLEAER